MGHVVMRGLSPVMMGLALNTNDADVVCGTCETSSIPGQNGDSGSPWQLWHGRHGARGWLIRCMRNRTLSKQGVFFSEGTHGGWIG